MSLNKKLFADFKKTPILEKIPFIQKNAEALIDNQLFEECLKVLESSGSEILQKKNGESRHKDFEIERKRLSNLPLEIEKRKKQDALKAVELKKQEEELAVIREKETDWEVKIKGLEQDIINGIVLSFGQNTNFESETFRVVFEDLIVAKPETLKKYPFKTYEEFLKQIKEYKQYEAFKETEHEEKVKKAQKQKRLFNFVGIPILSLAALTTSFVLLFKKSSTENVSYSKKVHEFESDRKSFIRSLKSKSDNLFSVVQLNDQPQLAVLADDYLITLRGFIEAFNYRDDEEANLLVEELGKISYHFASLISFSTGSKSFKANSIDEINKLLTEGFDPQNKLVAKKTEVYFIMSNGHMALYKSFVHRRDHKSAYTALKNVKEILNQTLRVAPDRFPSSVKDQMDEVDKKIKEYDEIVSKQKK